MIFLNNHVLGISWHTSVGMKQRIRVVAIIRNENGVLILKRNRGRSETPVFWELPTGKIKFGEQPEEAMTRSLSECTGLVAESIKLKDVITFLSPEGASQLSNLYIIYEVGVAPDAKPVPADRYTAYKYIKDFVTANVHLNETSITVLEIVDGKVAPSRISPRDTANSVVVNVDGASRGNPGPSGIGWCISDGTGRILEQNGEFRVAEYIAMRKGIDRAIELGYKSVRFISDSLMVVNQLNGIFTIKNQDIIPIYQDIQQKLSQFDAVSFTHISRTQNHIADYEANQAIDRILKK